MTPAESGAQGVDAGHELVMGEQRGEIEEHADRVLDPDPVMEERTTIPAHVDDEATR
ncbi:hypothetical protein [Brachybacterium sacelli]|uniref:Multidrug transporter n=1 Tax=Brachybacterium sacelli TaxID=173364 RepID=A0ABS4X0B2_9MICO|nr:hypothetical protein [Brachybacterium sacelli]MBP2381828.1 hypothetical protein [Brachybacterium sacelli]